MKARSTSLTLYHFEPGHHRDVCVWHDQDHKPEVIGTMPHVFISQRWVAPPDLIALRPPSTLEHQGGEYVNLYWSSGTPQEMSADFNLLGRRLEAVGRMQPMRYIHRTWGRRLVPISLQARSGLPLSAEAATFAPQTSALMLVVVELTNSPNRDAFAAWHETVHMPMILETGIFSAAAKLVSSDPDEKDLSVILYYSDCAEPADAYREFMDVSRSWRNTHNEFPEAASARRIVHSGMYRPSIGHYEYYD